MTSAKLSDRIVALPVAKLMRCLITICWEVISTREGLASGQPSASVSEYVSALVAALELQALADRGPQRKWMN